MLNTSRPSNFPGHQTDH